MSNKPPDNFTTYNNPLTEWDAPTPKQRDLPWTPEANELRAKGYVFCGYVSKEERDKLEAANKGRVAFYPACHIELPEHRFILEYAVWKKVK